MYNSDRTFIKNKMIPIYAPEIEDFGLYRRNGQECKAVYIKGSGEFQGPAATPQKFNNGAVIIKNENDIYLVQPKIFAKTYMSIDNDPISVEDIRNIMMSTMIKNTSEQGKGYGR